MSKSKPFVLTGIKEIDRKLRDLEPKVTKKHLRKALRAGQKIVAAAVREEAPRDSGFLAKQVKIRATKRSRKRIGVDVVIPGKPFYEAGPAKSRAGGKGKRSTPFYPAPVHFGTNKRPANDFAKRGLVRTEGRAAAKTLAELKRGLDTEVK